VLAQRNPELAAKAIQSHLGGAYHRLLATHPQQ
jgi:DNA-binding GntR family transcriptional regulator